MTTDTAFAPTEQETPTPIDWDSIAPQLTKAMRRVWALQDRPDPFANDRWGPARGWEAFGLAVAAALAAPENPRRLAAERAIRIINEYRERAVRVSDHCYCGSYVPDSSGDAGCGNCGADLPPELQP